MPDYLTLPLEDVPAGGDEHLVGTRYPGIHGVIATDLDGRVRTDHQFVA